MECDVYGTVYDERDGILFGFDTRGAGGSLTSGLQARRFVADRFNDDSRAVTIFYVVQDTEGLDDPLEFVYDGESHDGID